METNCKVSLLTCTLDPEVVIASAAKLCYSPSAVADLINDMTPDKVTALIEKLESMHHESPFEHASFTFAVEGISRALSHQLVRHRIASYSQKSQRYVNEDGFDFIIPPSISTIPGAEHTFLTAMKYMQEVYAILNKEYNIPAEDARFVLPNACETKVIFTMNVRTLWNFFEHRLCNRAQWEIRNMAWQMLDILLKVAPLLFKNTGPKCLFGKCSEGSMSCKRSSEVVTRYEEMIIS